MIVARRKLVKLVMTEAGRQIDPETAEVEWCYAQTLDPYGIDPDLPEECWQVGREYFARAPGSDVWVSFGDLPEAVGDALWEKYRSKLAFPAGLEALAPLLASRSENASEETIRRPTDDSPAS